MRRVHDLEAALQAARAEGIAVYVLPSANIVDRESLLAAVRAILPLDPPIQRGIWDAVADSLWEGLYNLDAQRIVIAWPNAEAMSSADPAEYGLAVSVLRQVSDNLANPKFTMGKPKELIVLLA